MANCGGIPGFYYDKSRKRYFKSRPGGNPPNGFQDTQRQFPREENLEPERPCRFRKFQQSLHDLLVSREYGASVMHPQCQAPLSLWKFSKVRSKLVPNDDTTVLNMSTNDSGLCVGISSRVPFTRSGGAGEKIIASVSRGLSDRRTVQLKSLLSYTCNKQLVSEHMLKLVSVPGLPRNLIYMKAWRNQTTTAEMVYNSSSSDESLTRVTEPLLLGHRPEHLTAVHDGGIYGLLVACLESKNLLSIYPTGSRLRLGESDCLSVHFTKDISLLTGHRNGMIYCRKYRQLLHNHSPPAQEVSVGPTGSGSAVIGMTSLPEYSHLVVSLSMNGQLALWDLRCRSLVHTYRKAYSDWPSRLPMKLPFSLNSDGSLLAAGREDRVWLWSTYTGALLNSLSLAEAHCPVASLFGPQGNGTGYASQATADQPSASLSHPSSSSSSSTSSESASSLSSSVSTATTAVSGASSLQSIGPVHSLCFVAHPDQQGGPSVLMAARGHAVMVLY